MKKVIEFFKNIKENLKNPKKKSLILIGIYVFFFIFVYFYLSASKDYEDDYKDYSKEDTNSINSYEYKYEIIDNDNISFVEGVFKDNKEVFNYKKNKYYIRDDKIYLVSDILIDASEYEFINPIKYRYSNIGSILKLSKKIEEIKYNNGSKKTTYSISLDDYNEVFKENLNCNDCHDVNIIVNESKYIDSILIDLSEYYTYNYKINLSYSNVNNIESLQTDFD